MEFKSESSAELFVTLEPEERIEYVATHFPKAILKEKTASPKENKVLDTTAISNEMTLSPKNNTEENMRDTYESDENKSQTSLNGWGSDIRRRERKKSRRLDLKICCKQCYKKMTTDFKCKECSNPIHKTNCSCKINGPDTNGVDEYYCHPCVKVKFPDDEYKGYNSEYSSDI
jgi:hypothetical protein